MKCSLVTRDVPTPLRAYFSFEEYERILGPLREFIFGTDYRQVRKTGPGIGVSIGLATAGIIGLAFGAPVALPVLGILGAGKIFGSYQEKQKMFVAQVEIIVGQINAQAMRKGLYLKDPLITNKYDGKPADIVDIEWVIY